MSTPDTAARRGPAPGAARPGRRLRRALARLALLALTASAAAAGVLAGDTPMPAAEALAGLLGADPGAAFIVRELRLPRVLAGLAVGAALGLSGAILQGLTRNPLAAPDLLGINAGAAVAAVAVIVAGGSYGGLSGPLAEVGLPVAAIGGAAAATAALLALTRGLDVVRTLLVGVGLHAALAAAVSWLLLTADIVDAGRAMVWLTGSLNDAGPTAALPPALALGLAAATLPALHPTVRALALGGDVAVGLGAPLARHRPALLALCVLLAATAVAAAGPIAFVALGAPQLAMRLLRTPEPPPAAAALAGAALTLWADWAGRLLSDSAALPVGVLTGGLGAPVLAYLIITTTRGDTR